MFYVKGDCHGDYSTQSAQLLISKGSTEEEFYEIMFGHLRRIYNYLKEYDFADERTYAEIERLNLAWKFAGSTGFHAAIKATCAQLNIPLEAVDAYIGQGYEGLKQADFYIADNIFKYQREKTNGTETG